MVIASELRAGMAIRIEGEIYKVLEAESKAGAAKLGGVVKTKLRNVTTGRAWGPHFRPQERLEDLELEQHHGIPIQRRRHLFMNLENFEQLEVPRAIVGPPEKFLQSGMQLPVEFFASRPISVVFPDLGEARVAITAPPTHSQQDSAWKEATLDNGIPIRVPLVIGPGEIVRVDVKTGRYVERVPAERKRSA